MKKEEIHFGDINRWLYGLMPPNFMIEVAIRTILIYLILLVVVRLLGKRMSGQITLVELAVMMTLGAIVSPVMQIPDRAILFGVVVLLVALIFQRGVNLWAVKNTSIEHLTVGKMSLLIKDGKILLDELDKLDITKEQLFAMLRQKKIQNLGKVKRAYLEACGVLSVFETKEPLPGLPVFPDTDPVVRSTQQEAKGHEMACCNCGNVQSVRAQDDECNVCHAHQWTKAYLQTT